MVWWGAPPPGTTFFWLAGAVAFLTVSLWSTDAAPVVAVLIPGLLLLPGMPPASRRRWAITLAAWYGTILPYAWTLLRAFSHPGEYVAGALLPLAWGVRALRLGKLFAYNFTPWLWAFYRRPWAPALPALVPVAVRLGLAGVGVVAVWGVVRGRKNTDEGTDGHRLGWIVGACLVLTLAANATFASVQLAEVCYRTHLLSRVWASLAVTAGVGLLLGGGVLRRALAWALVGVFVGLGIVGGLERQDHFLAYWQRHRTELQSIVESAPALVPGTFLLLYAPEEVPGAYRATQVDYLARAWTVLLYGDPTLRSLLWTGCRAEPTGFACPGVDRRKALLAPYSRLVLLTYRPAEGRYELAATIPPELLASGRADPGEVARYRPAEQILRRPPTALAVDLVERKTWLTVVSPAGRIH